MYRMESIYSTVLTTLDLLSSSFTFNSSMHTFTPSTPSLKITASNQILPTVWLNWLILNIHTLHGYICCPGNHLLEDAPDCLVVVSNITSLLYPDTCSYNQENSTQILNFGRHNIQHVLEIPWAVPRGCKISPLIPSINPNQ